VCNAQAALPHADGLKPQVVQPEIQREQTGQKSLDPSEIWKVELNPLEFAPNYSLTALNSSNANSGLRCSIIDFCIAHHMGT
jgi:hypothetical protein